MLTNIHLYRFPATKYLIMITKRSMVHPYLDILSLSETKMRKIIVNKSGWITGKA